MNNTQEQIDLKKFELVLPYKITGNKCPFCNKECPKWGLGRDKIQRYYCSNCNYKFNNKIWKEARERFLSFYRNGYKFGKSEVQKEFEGDLLKKDNHILGCMLESYENVLRYRGLNKEANMLLEVASRIK